MNRFFTESLKLRVVILLLFCTMCIIALPSISFAAWTIEAVDAPISFTNLYQRAIAIDKITNNPHIVYGKENLYHAYFDGIQWQYETVDSSQGVGQYASLSIDSNNKTHISYYDATNQDLKYATNASGSWIVTTVDSVGDVGQYPSIAVDSSDKIHISYYDATNQDLKYATNASGSWSISTIDSTGNMGMYTSIAVDSSDKIHISYYDATNWNLKYATNSSGTWVTATLESTGSIGQYPSIAVDSNNKVHISYADTTNGDLKYATNASGTWIATAVDYQGTSIGYYSSIAIDSNNKIHISYYDMGNADLKYATNMSGTWVTATRDGSGENVGMYTAIAIDSNNKVHISYFDSTNGYLKYATDKSGLWVTDAIDKTGWVGMHASIATSGDFAFISYYDADNDDLKYATNTSGSWVNSIIDSVGDVGRWSSIAIGSNIHISYYDYTAGKQDLKYATQDAGWWSTTTIDSTGNVGKYSSIAIDSNNKVHIAYSDETNYDLKYATNASGSWVVTTVDSVGNVGQYTSIAVDSSDKIHISYYDATNQDLKYATNASGSWVASTIDDTGYVGLYTSIALDLNNKVHVVYYDITVVNNRNFKYTTNASGSWVSAIVDIAGNVGYGFTSIDTDSNNKVHTCYYDDTNKDLKYATNVSGSWVSSTIDSTGDVGSNCSIGISDNNKARIAYYDDTNGNLKYARKDDITPPQGSVNINAGDSYTYNLNVELFIGCEDPFGSGCSEMQFSNDNISYSSPEAYTITKSWNLSSGEGTKTVYVKLKDNEGNWSDPYSDTIVLDDTINPTATITSPINGAAVIGTTYTIIGNASDIGSSIQHVEVSTDGGATWNLASGTTSWSYGWTLPADGTYTIKSRATDSAGNVETPGAGVTVTVAVRQMTPVTVSSRQILENGNPFTIKGIGYSPVPIGIDPEATPPYGDYFISDQSAIYDRDLPLLRQMGANTIRLWGWNDTANHLDFLDKAYNNGVNPIYVLAGFWINAGRDINPSSPSNEREQIKEEFRQMVAAHKNHPAILMWAIGNELNASWMYGSNLNNLFSLIEELAGVAHTEEGANHHPVTTPLADINLINTISTYNASVPSLDIWGANIYRGNTFGTLFSDYQAVSAKPLVILEYGIDAYDNVTGDEYENIGTPYQAEYARTLWNEIAANSATCIGGSIMEYSDEWWKGKYSTDSGCPDNDPASHSLCGYAATSHPDGYSNEEWWGIMRTRDNGTNPDIMELRAVYYELRYLWTGVMQQYTLTVTKTGTGSGTVTSSPTGISCGADCSEIYDYNTSVTLTATPDTGSTFAGWSGDADCSDGSVTMDADKNCTATFMLNTPNISSSPTSLNFGNINVNTTSPSQTVTFTNTGTADLNVTSGALTGTDASMFAIIGGTCPNPPFTSAPSESCNLSFTFTPTSAGAKTATFTINSNDPDTAALDIPLGGNGIAVSQYTLTVGKTGTGSGTVTATGIDCGSDCTEVYTSGTVVTLSPAPGTGSTFTGWTGCDSVSGNTCDVTVNTDKTVTAAFIPSALYVVWQDDTYGNYEIYLKKSTDGGTNWTTTRLTNNAGNSQNPVMAVDAGTVYIVWQDDTYGNNEIYLKKSTDGGTNWTTTRLTDNAGSSVAATIAVSGNDVYVVWQDDTYGNYEIYLKKSIDSGATWTTTRLTNNAGNSQYPSIVVNNAIAYIVWQDDTYGNNEIFVKKSTDGGTNWTTTRLTNNAGNSQFPVISRDPVDGSLYVVWQDDTYGPTGVSEIFVKKSTDSGTNWTTTRLTNNAGSSQFPSIVGNNAIAYIVWQDDTYGNNEIFVKKSTDGGTNWTTTRLTNNAGNSQLPIVMVSGSEVYIVWQDDTYGNNEIFIKKSTDGGVNWTTTRLTNNAGNSIMPAITK